MNSMLGSRLGHRKANEPAAEAIFLRSRSEARARVQLFSAFRDKPMILECCPTHNPAPYLCIDTDDSLRNTFDIMLTVRFRGKDG